MQHVKDNQDLENSGPALEFSTAESKGRLNRVLKVFVTRNGKSSLPMACFNLSNSVIGMGIIWLPLYFQISGTVMGLFMIFLSFLMSLFTSYLITVCSSRVKVWNYQNLVKEILGSVGYIVVSICSILLPFSICIAYSKLVSQTLCHVFEHFFPHVPILSKAWFVLILCLFGCAFPFTLGKHMSVLQHVSLFSIIFVIFYTTIFIYFSFYHSNQVVILPESWVWFKPGIAQAFAALALAYTAHHNVLSLYKCLHKNTVGRFTVVIYVAFGFTFLIYLIVVISGFIPFPGVIFGEILLNYCMDSKLMLVTRVVFCFSILTTLPLQIMSVRGSIFELSKIYTEETRLKRHLLTVLLVSLIFGLSLIPIPINIIIEITGALTTSPLVLIFPSLLYLKAVQRKYFKLNVETFILWGFIIIGGILMVVATVLAIVDYVTISKQLCFPRYWCPAEETCISYKS